MNIHLHYNYLCRGDTFRQAFSQLGEVRSLIPQGVHVMALTATATKATRTAVCHKIGMVCPMVVWQLPNKLNIKYVVVLQPGAIEDVFTPLVDQLRQERISMGRVIIYCRTYESCSMIYLFCKSALGAEMTEPVDLVRFRLVDMYCACSTTPVKNEILQSFCTGNSNLRVIIATIAFGMGLDCPNVRRVIHWGPSGDIEQYVQETGRAGRDGLRAEAILYRVGVKGVEIEESMREYCNNKDTCRRKLLLKHFDDAEFTCPSLTECCDICAQAIM